MRIRSQFLITMFLFGIVLIVVSTSVITTSQQVEEATEQQQIANSVAQGAGELSYLSNDYLIYRESQQLSRWQSKFASFSSEVASLQGNKPEHHVLVRNIQASQQRIKDVFDSIVSGAPSLSQGTAVDPAFLQVSWSRMAVQSQGLASDASRLSQLLRDQADQARQTNMIVMLVMMGIFGAYFLVNYLIVQRRLLKSIAALKAGTLVIGSGDLGHRIEEKNNDEIGELSRAFNLMTANLKAVTASKTDLETEIAERKQAEEALRESEQRWATTLKSIGDAVIATDAAGIITFMNPVAEELTGWSLSEARQKLVREVFRIINEHSRQVVDDPVTRVIEEGMVVGLANHTMLVRKDGAEVPIDDSGAPIRDDNGKITGVVLIFRDITERKQAEESLIQRTAEVEAANKELEAFAYSVSHDLRAPLRHIDGFSKILLAGYADKLDEQGKNYFGFVLQGTERMSRLIDGMLSLSRIARSDLRHEQVNLSELAREITEELRNEQPEREAEFVIASGALANGDSRLLRNVLENLLRNAWKFTSRRQDARIEFGSTRQDGRSVYYVRDNGAGFDMAYGGKLFSPFQRLHEEEEFPGTGIGLATVQRIIHRHGGRVRAEGEVGKGATFYFTLS